MKVENLLSVIVPIYNASAYLHKCVESILNQSYTNLDIILINDGSLDDSGNICDELSKIDKRIRVCHIENRGVVAAREYGVNIARGNLITFVDSDDWIESNMYLCMMEVYDQYEPDIISSGIIYVDATGNETVEYDLIREGLYNREQIEQEVIPFMMYDISNHRRAVTSAVWNKIIRKSLWKEVAQGLDRKITYGEDAAMVYPCLAKSKKVFFINDAWYHYCVYDNSMVHSFNINSFEKIKSFMDYMEKAYKKLDIWPQMKMQLKEYTKYFLIPAIEIVYDIKLGEQVYLFPYGLVRADSRIVIYGAGRVGKAYMRNLMKTNYAKVVAWVDKAYDSLLYLEKKVQAPEILLDLTFDFVVIAIESEEIAMKIKENLVRIGIQCSRIIWKKPEIIEAG